MNKAEIDEDLSLSLETVGQCLLKIGRDVEGQEYLKGSRLIYKRNATTINLLFVQSINFEKQVRLDLKLLHRKSKFECSVVLWCSSLTLRRLVVIEGH